jgi:hypothetical protein
VFHMKQPAGARNNLDFCKGKTQYVVPHCNQTPLGIVATAIASGIAAFLLILCVHLWHEADDAQDKVRAVIEDRDQIAKERAAWKVRALAAEKRAA